jgi:hypothetical protein
LSTCCRHAEAKRVAERRPGSAKRPVEEGPARDLDFRRWRLPRKRLRL